MKQFLCEIARILLIGLAVMVVCDFTAGVLSGLTGRDVNLDFFAGYWCAYFIFRAWRL